MIYIKETVRERHFVGIQVDGVLDQSSLPPLKEAIHRNLKKGKKVVLQLDGVTHADTHARDFLKEYRDKVYYVGISEFQRLEISDSDPLPRSPRKGRS